MPAICILYYITDCSAFPGDEPARRRALLEKVGEAARAGIDYIQLREKDLSSRDLASLAQDAVAVLQVARSENPELKTKLLINSRTDIALATGMDGVHLRSDDISPDEVRNIRRKAHIGAGSLTREKLNQGLLIGVSCHTPEEVKEAEQNGADFAVFAPVFEKNGATPAGLDLLGQACRVGIPVLALGAVTLENAQSCLQAGAAGIAAIRLFQENSALGVSRRFRTSN
jgi:thiamine-phosphate pyrophosphorylase